MKLLSVAADNSDGTQALTLYKDLSGAHLRGLTSYSFKVIALQFGTVCEDLATSELESEAVEATTTTAAIPRSPPSTPTLLRLDGCGAMVAVVPPLDHNGANPIGSAFLVSTSVGAPRAFVVDYYESTITFKDLIPFAKYSVAALMMTDFGNTTLSDALNFTTGAASAPSALPLLEIRDAKASSLVLYWSAPVFSGGGLIKGTDSTFSLLPRDALTSLLTCLFASSLGYRVYMRAPTANAGNVLIYDGINDPSRTSVPVTNLLARVSYVFSVLVTNEFNISSGPADNVIFLPELQPSVPAVVSGVEVVMTTESSLTVAYSKVVDTGGFAADQVLYNSHLRYLDSCYSSDTECATCPTLFYRVNTTFEPIQDACTPQQCASDGICCRGPNDEPCGTIESVIVACPSDSEVCEVDGLVRETWHAVSIVAENPVGVGEFSGEVFALTVDDGVIRLPGQPALSAASSTGGTITFVWDAPTFTGGPTVPIEQYRLEIEHPNGTIRIFNVSAIETSFTATRLQSLTAYKARIAAVNQLGQGSFSSSQVVPTPPPSAPSRVLAFAALDVTGGYVRLVWEEPADNGGYELSRYRLAYDDPDTGPRTFDVTGLSFSAGGLQAQRVYSFSIIAVVREGLFGLSTSITVETLTAAAPQPPTLTLAVATGGSLHFSVLSPVDPGGVPLTVYSVQVARAVGWNAEFIEFASGAVESDYTKTGIVANISMFDLLADSAYYVKASITNFVVSAQWWWLIA